MKKLWLILVPVLSVSLIFLFVGCGASTEETTTTTTTTSSSTTTTLASSTGVVMEGKMTGGVGTASILALAQKIKAFSWPPGTEPGNTNYPIIVTTPETYAVGIWRARLFRGLSDTSPYLLATWETVGNTPGHYALSTTPTQMAINANYPDAGTYTHMVPTLAYLEQQLPASIIDFSGSTRFRIIMATYSSYQRGDVLVYSGGAWNWLDQNSNLPVTSRPTMPVTVDWGAEATAEVNGHIVFEPTDVSLEGFVMPASPSGVYNLTMIFDVHETFAFNDVNNSGVFEPGALYPSGDVATPTQVSTMGAASWGLGPPNMSITIEVQ